MRSAAQTWEEKRDGGAAPARSGSASKNRKREVLPRRAEHLPPGLEAPFEVAEVDPEHREEAADQILPTGGVTGTVLVVHALEKRRIRVSVSTAAVVVGLLGYHAANAFSILSALTILWVRGDLHQSILLPVTLVSLITGTIPIILIWLARGGAKKSRGWVRRLPGVKQLLDAIASAPRSTLEDGRLFAYDTLLQFSIMALDAATLFVLFLSLGQLVDLKTVFEICSWSVSSLAARIPLTMLATSIRNALHKAGGRLSRGA